MIEPPESSSYTLTDVDYKIRTVDSREKMDVLLE